MELIVSNQPQSTMAEKLTDFLKYETRYGAKDCYIVPESKTEEFARKDALFFKETAPGTYKLQLQLSDKSICYLNVHATNPRLVSRVAKEYVLDLMHVADLDRVVWSVQGEETLHFECKAVSAKSKIQAFFSNVKSQLDDFFWFDGE